MARLKEQYVNEIAPALNSKFGYKSVMQIPKLDKVVINVACGEAKENEKILEAVMKDLGQITGQKAASVSAAAAWCGRPSTWKVSGAWSSWCGPLWP